MNNKKYTNYRCG